MLGDIICKLRKQKDFSQSYLGEMLNLSASTIGMYEQNRRLPDIDVIVNLCKLFSVSSDYLLEISDNHEQYKQSNVKDTIQERISFLMEYNSIDISFVADFAKIRKQRLDDILTKGKKPDANELIVLANCFSVSTDYLLGLTDEQQHNARICAMENTFLFRMSVLMDGYTEAEVANSIDISIAKLRKLISGDEQPTPDVLCLLSKFFNKSTDYLLGLVDNNRDSYENGTYPFKIDLVCIERLQAILESDTDNYLPRFLGITDDEYYHLYHYGFLPHISVLQKLCEYKHVSSDFLLNFSLSQLTIEISKDSDEDELIKNYRKLAKPYKKKIDGIIAEQLLQQERDSYMRSSVAADDDSEGTLGKSLA